jgi:hypothetical protein
MDPRSTRELIVEEGGFVYDSDAYNDDLPYFVAVRQAAADRTVFDDLQRRQVRSIAGIWPADFYNPGRGLDQLWDEGAAHPRMMSVGLHPRLIGQASRVHALPSSSIMR